MRYWIVHGGEFWPIPRGYEPDLELNPPPLGHGLSQTPFELEPEEEQRKRLAINAYRTQMEVMSSFLLSFVRHKRALLHEPDAQQPRPTR